MASRKCDQCGATVAADEQFCPNCGSFIDPLAPSPALRGDNVISVNSDGNYEEFDLGAPPPPYERSGSRSASTREIACPSCGAVNPANNRHCQECGARLSQGPLPTAPRPAVQATAGVRAALAISALLIGVVVIALLFNIFNGGAEATSTTTATGVSTTTTVAELQPIDVLLVECSQEGIGAFVCDNLISGTEAEYQFTYEGIPEGEPITIRLTFNQPMVVQRIDWVNLEDPVKLKRNYRARGIIIEAQDSVSPIPIQLEDVAGSQTIPYAAIDTNWIQITIESDYQAEVVEDNVFREMAIQEIRVIGRPAVTTGTSVPDTSGATSTTTAPGSTTVPGSTTTTP
ncbi:MAG: zinc-ribbon domain-containing protein [Acidimicrobiia bacterium]